MNSADPRQMPGQHKEDNNHAIGRWVSGAGQVVSSWTTKKYALPDKTVASQILMYRQLLHTSCRPGLVLSRKYEATPAQVSVQHMPWWETTTVVENEIVRVLTMVDTGKMVISYDNLITRLWNTALEHHGVQHATDVDDVVASFANPTIADAAPEHPSLLEVDLLDPQQSSATTTPSSTTLLPKDRTQLPPIPHEYWVSNLGFQQTDPVTDFRSGGILSLALMVWIVEHCPNTYRRFCRDDPAAVLPFGITSINVTDMIAKLLMLSKRTDRMDALLSQKPFWKMFSDPYAILTVQELALELLADVVDELVQVRRLTATLQNPSSEANVHVSVFDFTHILTVTEQRVEYDLLGAGPISIQDLRQIHLKLRVQYQKQLQSKLDRLVQKSKSTAVATDVGPLVDGVTDTSDIRVELPEPSPNKAPAFHEQVLERATGNKLIGTVVASTNGFLANNPIWKLPFQKKKNDPSGSDDALVDAVPTNTSDIVQTESVTFHAQEPIVDLLDTLPPLPSSDDGTFSPSELPLMPPPGDEAKHLPTQAALSGSEFQISDDDDLLY